MRAAAVFLAVTVAIAVDRGLAADVAQTVATVEPARSSASSAAVECPDACIEIYSPVCGSDGVTYSNSCFLRIAQCKYPGSKITQVSDAECAAESTPEPTTDAASEASSGGEADDCANRVCPMDYSPVCGSNGKTYSNSCMLDIAQCKTPSIVLVGDGACEERAASGSGNQDASVGGEAADNVTASPVEGSGCPDMCPMIYSPVCGSDGKTYSNSCALHVVSCKSPKLNLTQVGDGECSSTDSASGVDQTAV